MVDCSTDPTIVDAPYRINPTTADAPYRTNQGIAA
jgi:hypothetical protein